MAKHADLNFKGFSGSIEASIEDCCLFGRIQFINDIITYEGSTVPEIKAAFEEAVNGYLAHCIEVGKVPNTPYSGSFNVRVGSELHKEASQMASSQNENLNQFVTVAIRNHINSLNHNKLQISEYIQSINQSSSKACLWGAVNQDSSQSAAANFPGVPALTADEMIKQAIH